MRNLSLAVLMGTLGFAALGFGQATDGIIVGNVVDASGSAVMQATVTATNKDTGVKYTSGTNETGGYRLNNVPVGRYDVSAASKGFATAVMADVQLDLNHTATVNLVLAVGTLTTQVDVTESQAQIDTSTAQLQATYDSRAAMDVGAAGTSKLVGGAGIWNLSLLGAGVTSSGGVGQGTGPSVAGQRPENNSFNIDGVGNDDHYVTGPQVYISNEAVQQFNIVQNQFSAEFGGGSGGIFNAIVKTGTNSIHGSVYEYMQNRKLDAVDASNWQQGLTSLPRYDFNRLGATIGGPILKDKLFYFGNFEYAPLGQAAQPAGTVYAPTAAGLSILSGMSNVSQTNLGVFKQYVPVATTVDPAAGIVVNNVNIPAGPLSFASPNYNNQYNAVVAIDYNLSDKDQIRGRFIYANSTGIDFLAALPVFYQPNPNITKSISVSEFHNFSPTMENELRVSYKRYNGNIPAGNYQFPGLAQFPNIAIDELNLQIGPDPNTPSGSIENQAQLQENITKSWGRHTIKAGYDAIDLVMAGYFIQRARGDYDYNSLQTYLLDLVPDGSALSGVTGERSVGQPPAPFGFVQHAAFVNDDFRLRPNLTLNLGVRYEYVEVPVGSRAQAWSAPADVPGVISFASPKSNKNEWSPRIGFAYSPGKSGVWSIRGGFSRAFANTYINLNQNAAPAYYQTTVDVDSSTPPTNFLKNGGLSANVSQGVLSPADARAQVASYTFDQTRPYALNGTLGVQRSFAHDYTFEARYVYTKGVHLWNQTRMNIISPVTPSDYLPTYFAMPSAATLAGLTTTLGQLQTIPRNVWAQYGFPNNVVGYHPWGNSRYNGLALQLTKRYSKNFSVLAAYTWSHNFDDSTATNFSTILSPRRAQDFQNMRAEWASSALDRRHRVTVTPIYDFKPFAQGNWLLKNVVGNWNLSTTYTYQSPEYATVQSGIDANLNGDTLDRSIINPAGNFNVGSAVTGYTATGQAVAASTSCAAGAACKQIVAYVANNPNARFVTAGLGALANAGRNQYPLDPINNFDFALMKRLNIKESKKFEIGIQTFNLFNHSQFIGGYISDVAPKDTHATSTAFLQPRNADFGDYKAYFSNNARQAQIVARITF